MFRFISKQNPYTTRYLFSDKKDIKKLKLTD